MNSPDPILQVESLRVSYHVNGRIIGAIRDATLEVGEGEAVGLVGESGSGKSSLARAVLGLLPERVGVIEGGRITIAGRDVTACSRPQWEALRGNPVAIVFQDPLSFLNPVMRVDAQIRESVIRHDRAAPTGRRIEELFDLVKLPHGSMRCYPHELSGGMRQRVLLAIALGCRPRLLVADEPTTALDVTTQAEILALIRDMRQRLNMALLLISHDLALVGSICTRVYVMYGGQTVEWGPANSVFARPAHPYTTALLKSARVVIGTDRRFATIEGDVPNSADPIAGCPFAPRCAHTGARCRSEMPRPMPTREMPDHQSRCWLQSQPQLAEPQP